MSFELKPFDLPENYGEDILSLASIKQHLRVTSRSEDDLIGFFRDAAVDMVERFVGVRLGLCTGLQWAAEYLPQSPRLGVWPVTEVSAISWLDSDGVEVAGDAAIWRLGQRGQILLKPGQSLPSGVAGGVVITFDAGFTAANRPPKLVQAVRLFAAYLYENRTAGMSGGAIEGDIPAGVRMLAAGYRMPTI